MQGPRKTASEIESSIPSISWMGKKVRPFAITLNDKIIFAIDENDIIEIPVTSELNPIVMTLKKKRSIEHSKISRGLGDDSEGMQK